MYAVTGITGQVGGAVARALLGAGQSVRAVVRSAEKGESWAQLGCEVALAEVDDAQAMASAFSGTEGVFIMMPSNFDPLPGFPEARLIIDNIRQALERGRPAKVICLSTIDAHVTQPNLLNQLQLLERGLSSLGMPVTFLRPGWFMENAVWDIAPAVENGVVPSFLQPLDKPVPMIATADVGRVGAELLQEQWEGLRIVELESVQRVTPNQIAASLSQLLGKPVTMSVVPREDWSGLFTAQGARNPQPRMQMIDGFNEGWIEFSGTPRKGLVVLETVLCELVRRAGACDR